MKTFSDQSFNRWVDEVCTSGASTGLEAHILDYLCYALGLFLVGVGVGFGVGSWLF